MKPTISPEEAFARLGAITRQLHEALIALGAGSELQTVVSEIPDARERLAYVGRMTEDAANKVLNLVDVARPECETVASQGRELADSLRRLAEAPDMSVERARAMMKLCAGYADRAASFAQAQHGVLGDIMLSQSFQDLSGQVIKKVIDIITRTEHQLLDLLVDSAPEQQPAAAPAPSPAPASELAGPQVPDKALKQDEVDDLLASLGF
ncbi:protein phosphatase CheZ [Caldimonas thermodepolymerans]|jgi:Chemotaxis protein|uniref:Protein phosphatase CheZ n=1 Tax=Caldimonas thermodepolymerans TaxID=215580 RepID=A0A2S5T422_9BURK|nr:protein phosphatase CheZ [Caldimonas thermodepolymerans]PPE69679.1 chemotaxis protein CheZ [Caldimonas thermodepolymerans]QPC31911.1 protein phosphatase CheZ [Caldimonas thermodepolymerans]RDI01571.1 chemotaxis protein CheZ [Caldimonas thermodepolymerans]TCP04981.1 chemotaxis protein CheZ [Caldimonas thermodepolymerans]UZG48354.1 protein phosphatase CheZ [Caldimonas thermodepolymerans]